MSLDTEFQPTNRPKKRARACFARALTLPFLGALVVALTFLSGRVPGTARPVADEDEKRLLLEPEALKAALPRAPLEEIRRHFADPPAEFRTAPLWVWNDEMDPERLKEQLRQFKEQGIGGVFIHPRPGLITEYLGEEWFGLWQKALDEAKGLGLLCNIYDENSYPSGFAGGHVPSLAPDTAAQYVQAHFTEVQRGARGPATLAVFKIERDEKNRVVRAVRVPEREYAQTQGPMAVFSLRRASGNPWTAQFPYVDLTNPETTRWFIHTTFEAYKQRFGKEFGKAVRWAFDDEPLLATAGAYEGGQLALPLSYRTLAEFQKRNGYDLRDVLPSLFWDVGDWRRVRFDYWQTLHDLWKESYLRPLFEWCDRNGLQLTGHFMEHEWPYPWISPADASLAAYLHMPGIDMLVGAALREKGADPHMLFTIRQLASVSEQLGRRAFCEAYGVSGWDSTFEHYKRMGDWLMVNGVDFIDQHLAFATVRGARKRDHPQSFSDVSAWWPYYRLHADHTARLSYVLAQGEARNRVLVLEPTTSGFLWARRDGDTPELQQLGETFDRLNQFLVDHQVDFDLGDEYLLEWFGEARGNKLAIAKATYDLLIWPQGMINLRRPTLPALENYLKGGGEILALDTPAAYVDGRPTEAVVRLRKQYASQWRAVADHKELLAEIRRRLAPRVTFDQEAPVGLGHRQETLANGDVLHLFTNASSTNLALNARVEGASLEEWDTVSGKIGRVPFRAPEAGKIEIALNLPPAGSRLFVISANAAPAEIAPRQAVDKARALQLTDWKVTPASPNVLALDYCDLRLAGQTYENINSWQANWRVWQAHGFERPAWDNATQFKRTILDRPPFGPDSGFEATFSFRIADALALSGLHLALENPELYKVYVNGHALDSSGSTRWLDPHLKSIPVETLLQVGENIVRVVAAPFDVRMELENIYLRGNFAVQAAERGFSIHAPRPLQLGSWLKQGYPFYYDSVLYEARATIPKNARRLRVSFPDWQGSVAEVLLDGNHVQTIGWQPYVCEAPVTPGPHAIGLRIVATPRNLFGPFHNPRKPRMIAWPGAWSEFPENQPSGSQYDLLDYGLMGPFSVEALP
jgi:hypothetical protein